MKLHTSLLLLVLLAFAPRARAADPVIAAAGDIACDPADTFFNGGLGTATACRMEATSDLALAGVFQVRPDILQDMPKKKEDLLGGAE